MRATPTAHSFTHIVTMVGKKKLYILHIPYKGTFFSKNNLVHKSWEFEKKPGNPAFTMILKYEKFCCDFVCVAKGARNIFHKLKCMQN